MKRKEWAANFPVLAQVFLLLTVVGAGVHSANAAGEDPVLVPTASFALADAGRVTRVAMSPEGTLLAVATQERLGAPVTLRSYDASTGEVVATVEAKVLGLYRLHWMADNRLVAADRDARPGWRIWNGSTLQELPTLSQDLTCSDGPANRNTGAVYSSAGITSMSDVICRFDSRDGSTRRSAERVLVGAERFWVRAGTNEIAVLHSPDPQVSLELVFLDGDTLAPKNTMPVQFDESVEAVGQTAWISNTFTRKARLEPGAIPVEYRGPIKTSGAGRFFLHANGMDDLVIISATDGKVVGTMPAGMNVAVFAAWSLDDSWFVRLTVDQKVEVYHF